MQNKIKYVIVAVLFVLFFALAIFAYNHLSDAYDEETLQSDNESVSISESHADDFTVFTADGTEVNLSDYFGKPVVVNFWASWCGPCKSELPAFEKLYVEMGSDVAFMMVNLTDNYQETLKSAESYIEKQGYTFPVFYDMNSDAANTYFVYSIPYTLFIDENGVLVDSYIGAMSENMLRNYIAKIY